MVFARLAVSAVLIVWLTGAAAHAEPHIVQTATSISIRPDRHSGETTIDFGDGAHRINLDDPALSGAVVFGKKAGKAYRTVVIDGVEVALPAPVEPRTAVPFTDATAPVETGATGESPRVALPDFSQARAAELAPPPRTASFADHRRLVRAEVNPPTVYLRTPIANQTAHGDDPSRKSVYLAASNTLFNPSNGQADSILHYLIEIPLDPAWMTVPGDARLNVDSATIRAHITTEKLRTIEPPERITGERGGGLTQSVGGALVAEDGNIYFHRAYRGPIRFNVREARYEVAPVDLWTWYLGHLRAADSDIRRAHPDAIPRPDFDQMLFSLDDRLYVIFSRYYDLGRADKDLLVAAVLSAPLAHWDDKDAFQREVRIIAESYPTAPHRLFDRPVEPKDERCKLRVFTGMGRHLLLFSNSFDRLWWIHLDRPGGATQQVIAIDTELDGKHVDRFDELGVFHLDEGGEVVGLEIGARLDGSTDWTPTWIGVSTAKLSTAVPTAPAATYRTYSDFAQRHHLDYTRAITYGESRWARNNFARELGMVKHESGNLTLLWDAQDAIRDAARRADPALLGQMFGFSGGPGFMIAPVPGETGRVIGAADYPAYYLAHYDIPRTGDVTRHMIASESAFTPVSLGPYAHAWRGRELWIAGYIGIVRFTGDGPVQRTSIANDLRDLPTVDGVTPGPIKWFTDLSFGLGGKLLAVGYDSIGRGGTPYSTGLRWKADGGDSPWHALPRLARTLIGRKLATRFRVDADGSRAIDVMTFASPDDAMAAALGAGSPQPRAARLVFYADRGDTVVERFSLALDLAPEAVVVADNGLYALLLTTDGLLATLDLDALRFVDAVRLPGRIDGSDRRPTLLRAANLAGGVLIVEDRDAARHVLLQVDVGGDGAIALKPLMTLLPDTSKPFDGAAALLPRDDGTVDLLIGPPPMRGDATLVVVPDVLAEGAR